jgi:hypothetical protein
MAAGPAMPSAMTGRSSKPSFERLDPHTSSSTAPIATEPPYFEVCGVVIFPRFGSRGQPEGRKQPCASFDGYFLWPRRRC